MNLKDCHLTNTVKSRNISGDGDTAGLSNSILSLTACVSMWRSLHWILGEADFAKTDTSGAFRCNPPMENQGIIDGHFCKRNFFHDKA